MLTWQLGNLHMKSKETREDRLPIFPILFSGGFAVTDLFSFREDRTINFQHDPGEMPERTSENMPEKMSKQMSRQMIIMPQRMFERMSEDMSEIMSEDMQRIAAPRGSKQFRHWWWSWPKAYLRRFATACCEWSCWSLCSFVELLLRLFVCTSWGITRHLLALFLASLLFILSDILSGISSEMISDSLSGVSSDNLSDILFGPPDILSGILAQLLTFCLTLFAYVPSFCLTFFLASLMSNSILFYPCT